MKTGTRYVFGIAILAGTMLMVSCGKDPRSTGIEYAPNMYHSAAFDPFTQIADNRLDTNYSKDGKILQELPYGVIAIDGSAPYPYTASTSGYDSADKFLFNPLTAGKENMDKGKLLYDRFCGICHGEKGNGDGHLVKIDKFPPPPSYSTGNSSRGGAMKDLSQGKIYHTIMYGLNMMGSYASQLNETERWQVTMYVASLQGKDVLNTSGTDSLKKELPKTDGK